MKEYPTDFCKYRDCSRCELEQLCERFLEHFEAMTELARKSLERLEEVNAVYDRSMVRLDGICDSVIGMYEELMDRHSEVTEQNARLIEALDIERKKNEKLYQLLADSIKKGK